MARYPLSVFTPAELAAEHARAMRIVKAVLAACDARAATARAARAEGFKEGDARWVLSIGKAAIGMAEGMKDVCGEPRRHLIVTVDGPAPGSLANILRSDHPLPTQRSLDAGQGVKRFIEEAKAAGAPSLTVLMSGGASALICEPIPGLELAEYREVVRAMLEGGWDIQRMNTVRRAIDGLKGGRLLELSGTLPVDQFILSDVVGDALHDIGSGPWVWSPTTPDDACVMLERAGLADRVGATLVALSCSSRPSGLPAARRSVLAAGNELAVRAALAALVREGIDVVSERSGLAGHADRVAWSTLTALRELGAGQGMSWGGEWTVRVKQSGAFGGRCQWIAEWLSGNFASGMKRRCLLTLATDGVDGTAPPGCSPAAGAFVASGMKLAPPHDPLASRAGPDLVAALTSDDDMALHYWALDNSYICLAHADEHRPIGQPPVQVMTGPTGTNVNDLIVAWCAK